MKVIGLTGGIGCGKSYVAEIFRHLGVPVYEADAEARNLQDTDPELKAAIRKIFGDAIYGSDGCLDRKEVARRVFSDNVLLEKLNAVVHPAVAGHFSRWCEQQSGAAYVIKEAAILFESGSYLQADGVIVVTAPQELRIARVMARDHTDRESVLRRMQAQWPEEEKIRRADFVIVNDEKLLLLPQTLRVHEEIRR